jgi:hypothetical protein
VIFSQNARPEKRKLGQCLLSSDNASRSGCFTDIKMSQRIENFTKGVMMVTQRNGPAINKTYFNERRTLD